MYWDDASVIIADIEGGARHLLAKVAGYYLGNPDADWIVVGSGTLVNSATLSNVQVVMY